MLNLYEVFKGFSNHLDGENKMNTKTISPFCDRKHRFWIFSKLFALGHCLFSLERFARWTFFSFLLGGSESFKDKQDFFYRELVVYHGKKAGEVNLRIDRHKLLESVSC